LYICIQPSKTSTHSTGSPDAPGLLIRQHWDDLLLWRTLIQLRTNLPIPRTTGQPHAAELPAAPEIVGALNLWK
jgi:hypothetical protein